MGVNEGRGRYNNRLQRPDDSDLKSVAANSKLGLGRVRGMAKAGNAEAKQVLRDLSQEVPERHAGYDE